MRASVCEGGASAALTTDGDGTLWTHDIGEALFEHVLHAGLVREPGRAALLEEARAHGLDVAPGSDAATIARALFDAYVALTYPEDRMCAAMAWCMAGTRRDELDAACDDVLERSFGLRAKLIPEALAIVRWAASRGVAIWLVSASPRAIVERAAAIVAAEAGVETPRVIAMTPNVEGDVIRPGIAGVWTYGEGKRVALEAALDGGVAVGAMGDNVFDVPMLQASRVPIAIRPKPALVRAAGQVPGLVRLTTPD